MYVERRMPKRGTCSGGILHNREDSSTSVKEGRLLLGLLVQPQADEPAATACILYGICDQENVLCGLIVRLSMTCRGAGKICMNGGLSRAVALN